MTEPTLPTELTGELLGKYEEERSRLSRRRMGTACLLAACIVPFYGISDYLLYPEYLFQLLSLRVIEVVSSVMGLVLIRSSLGERFPNLLGVTIGLVFALTASGIPMLLLGDAVPYQVGFMIVIFSMALLLPWRFVHAAALAFSLIVLYVILALLHGSVANWVEFAVNVSVLGTSVGIALVSMNAGEELRLREFRTRVALADAYNNKSQLAGELADKSAKLESLNREMADLLYVASHDLRAPLINVQGFSRELQLGLEQLRSHNGKSPETNAALTEFDESLQFILTGVARMDGLINSLLSISRITTRTNPTERVDLNSLLGKLTGSFHYQLTEKAITLAVDPLPVVTGDPVRLGQLFGNLIDNAIKYMSNRSERRIHVGVRPNNGEPHFFVRDTGPGIAQQDQEQIFRLFRRLVNGDCPGEGIGLTMVRKIVEKHGGRIWVDSAPGAGATFWFTLRALPELEIGGVQ